MVVRRQDQPSESKRVADFPGRTVADVLFMTGLVLLLGALITGIPLLEDVSAGRWEGAAVSLITALALWASAWLLFATAKALELLGMIVGNLRLVRQPLAGGPAQQ